MNPTPLSVDNLACGFRHKVIGRDISFALAEGEVLAVLGPNGAGKTTLFRTVLRLLPAHAGSITLLGKPIAAYTQAELARAITYVPQAHAAYFPFRVADMVLMGRGAHLGLFASPGARDREVAAEALRTVGIEHLAERPFNEISGGEQQLTLLARALATEARILVLDEPTANLDYGNQWRVQDEILRLRERGHSVLLCTHHPDHALHCADRVLLIKAGTLVAQGNTRAVLTPAALAGLYGIDPARVGGPFGQAR